MSDVPRIRPFEARDESEVVALWRVVFAADPPRNEPRRVIARKQQLADDLLLVAELDGRVIGTVIAGYDGYRGWLYHLAVEGSHRRRGFGRALVREAEARLRARGCIKVNLQVRETNGDVVAFYRRIGYGVEPNVSLGRSLEEPA